VFTHAVIIAAVASATISSPVNPIEVMLPRQHHFFNAILPGYFSAGINFQRFMPVSSCSGTNLDLFLIRKY
jgi:hypothetical protein